MEYKPNEAEWNSLMRGNKLTSTVNLKNWSVIYFQKNEAVTTDFLQTLVKVALPMGIVVEKPNMLVI